MGERIYEGNEGRKEGRNTGKKKYCHEEIVG
jgi:hypothetical protein